MKFVLPVIFLVFIGNSPLFAGEAAKLAAKPATQSQALQTATFAAGCFWGVEEFFRKIPGVTATKVGYAGGSKANPAYEDVSGGSTGHAESVELKFDPKVISYEQLLSLFFKIHDPTTLNRQGNDSGTQYRSEIFANSKEQKEQADKFMAKVQKSGEWKAPITTKIEMAGPFYAAEDYHQKYLVKHPGGYDNHFLRNFNFEK